MPNRKNVKSCLHLRTFLKSLCMLTVCQCRDEPSGSSELPVAVCVPVVSSNQSHGEYPDCRSEKESGGEASLLVSPLVVAGIVIGLVLFLSCITIIIGSLRKDSRLRNPHFGASYGQSLYQTFLVKSQNVLTVKQH